MQNANWRQNESAESHACHLYQKNALQISQKSIFNTQKYKIPQVLALKSPECWLSLKN